MKLTNKVVNQFAKTKTMSSLELAKMLVGDSKDAHSNFVIKMKKVLGEIGVVNFQDSYLSKQNKQLVCYNLPEREAHLMAMSYSYELQAQVYDMFVELSDRVNQLEQEKINRASASLNYKDQSTALHDYRDSIGKETLSHHYSTEANMLNRLVLGVTAAGYRKENNLSKDDNLRDTLSVVTLECLASLESTNKELIKVGINYSTRKDMLTKIYKQNFDERLIEEYFRLEA